MPEPEEQEKRPSRGRADFKQCGIRLSPEGWQRFDALIQHYGGLSQSQTIEVMLAEQTRLLEIEGAPRASDTARSALLNAAKALQAAAKEIT